MPIGPSPLRLALLIDAENVPASVAQRLMIEAAARGDTRIRRCYGSLAALKAWEAPIESFAMEARAIPSGKNSADIALVIDAMDLVHAGAVDGLCVVSRDSDFRALAIRAREAGVLCHGFAHGESSTLRAACSSFKVLAEPCTMIREIMSHREEIHLGQLGNELRKIGYVRNGKEKLTDLVAKCTEFFVSLNTVRRTPPPSQIAAE